MPKKKQPEGCTEEVPVTVTEESSELPTVEATVTDNDRTKEEILKSGEASTSLGKGEASNQAPTAATELTELEVAELGPFWSLLRDAGYTIW